MCEKLGSLFSQISKALHYISDLAPRPGGGGGIILYRHLAHLAAQGWQVEMATPADARSSLLPPGCCSLSIPARKWYWPPFRTRPEALLQLRLRLSAADIRRRTALTSAPAAVLTACTGPTSLLAAKVAQNAGCPLLAIVHDWWGETEDALLRFTGDRVCFQASQILCVSEEMQAVLAARHGQEKCTLLYPVPSHCIQNFATWRDSHNSSPVIAHVGALHEYHLSYLTALAAILAPKGGRLLLLCPKSNPVLARLRAVTPNLWHQDYFPSNEQALSFIAEQASGLTVMYPNGLLPSGLPPTGFPSRFVEFAQLGLPTLLAAPTHNPIRSWAAAQAWTAACDPTDLEGLSTFVSKLTQSAGWTSMAAQTRLAAQTVFSSARIQAQLHSLLQRLTS